MTATRPARRHAARSAFVRRDLRAAVVPWLVARVVVGVARLLSPPIFDRFASGARPVQLDQGLFPWDAAFYRAIAEHGYAAVGRSSLRFFPLVPLLGRALGWVLAGHTAFGLLVVVNGSALLFGAFLHRLALLETHDEAVARRAVWWGALFPAAFVLVLGYAEATAMLLGVLVFLGLRTRRPAVAVVAGYLAGLCRPVGILLVVPAVIEAARNWPRAPRAERALSVAAVVAPVLGVVTYLVWVGSVFGDAWLPISLQNQATLRGGFQDPFTRTFDAFRDLVSGRHVSQGLHVVWAALFVALVVVLARRLPSSYAWYSGVTVVVALSAHNLDSLERYCMSAFPFALALALVTRREVLQRVALAGSAALLAGYTVLAFLGKQGP